MPEHRINGLSTHYEIQGEGEPLVFIHGLGSSGRDWESQADYFSKLYQVVTYDVRGHGQTDKPPGPYSIPMFAADLAGMIEAFEIAPVHLVGYSMGGWIAFQLAVDYPELLKSLVIVNSSPELVPRTLQERFAVWQRTILFRLLSMRKIGEILSKRIFIKADQEELRRTFVERWAENHKPAYMAAFKAAVGWSVADQLGDIHTPTLVLTTSEDYTSVAEKETYTALMPNAGIKIIDDARHAPQVEKPDEFNQQLGEFLSQI
ncbi:MAG: alpha/beta hydrolase [Chloroflexi bacterium]|nr:alpha/beta hydrolase [Chloroflexota bacterium]